MCLFGFFVCFSSHFGAAKIAQALTFENAASGIILNLVDTFKGKKFTKLFK